MGYYRFAIPESDRFSRESLMSAQIVGLEGIPWPCKTSINEDQLIIFRNTNISGRLLVPFRSERYGDLGLTTGTLPQQEKPYLLELELARGSLSRLRNQVSLWEEGGLVIDPEFETRLTDVTHQFTKTVFLTADEHQSERVELCVDIVQRTLDMMFEITNEYSKQVTEIRRSQEQPVSLIFGVVTQMSDPAVTAGDEARAGVPPVQRTIDTVTVAEHPQSVQFDLDAADPVVQWINQESQTRILGPLIDFSLESPPPWLAEDSAFESRLTTAVAFCRQIGQRYSGKIRAVHVAAGLNGVGHLQFSYPQQLQLSLEMLDTLDQSLAGVSLIVSFDQPWGERLSMATGGAQAMEIADSLLRYGARISAFGLEFNLAYWPHGTMLRDPLQWVDLIDRWSQFGLPLATYFSAPSGDVDSQHHQTRFFQTICGGTSPQRYTDYLSTIFRLLANRPSINILAWRYLCDTTNPRFPLAGLLDESLAMKPMAVWLGERCNELTAVQPAANRESTNTN